MTLILTPPPAVLITVRERKAPQPTDVGLIRDDRQLALPLA